MAKGEGDDIITIVIVSEVNMVDGSKDWVTDFGTTRYICNNDFGTARYICSNKNFFFDYTLAREGEEVIYLSDSWSTLILGKG